MSARSRSAASFTTSRAVSSADGSMRMSSAASAAYEKPRSGRSSCIDETPRSRRIASAWSPFVASWSSTCENSPCSSRTFAVVERRKRSKYGVTVGSRSIAISFPSPRSRAASRAECPPAPKVQSTIVSPGCGARAVSTSSARTGTWSVSVGKTLGNIFCAPFDCLPLVAPGGAVPDLEMVVDACHGHVAADAGALEQVGRNHDPPLPVELRLDAGSEEEPLHRPRLAAERVERAHALGELGPLGSGVDVEAAVESARDHDPVAELVALAGGQREPVLVVQGVLVLAQQHRSPSPIVPHFNPLEPSCKPLSGAVDAFSTAPCVELRGVGPLAGDHRGAGTRREGE